MEHSRGQRQGSGISTKRNVQGQRFLEEFREGKAGLSYPWGGSLGTAGKWRCGTGRARTRTSLLQEGQPGPPMGEGLDLSCSWRGLRQDPQLGVCLGR